MKKEEIRKKYISFRKALTSKEVEEMSLKIFQQFKDNFSVAAGENVHIFLSIEKFNEVDTTYFINCFKEMGAKVFVPKMIENKLIAVELLEENSLIRNSFGILEPPSIITECSAFKYIITPLLYADNYGNRVGYGKGYYDSFFSSINSDAIKIGINFFPPKEDIDDISATDVPLDYLITPELMLSFNGFEKKSRK